MGAYASEWYSAVAVGGAVEVAGDSLEESMAHEGVEEGYPPVAHRVSEAVRAELGGDDGAPSVEEAEEDGEDDGEVIDEDHVY